MSAEHNFTVKPNFNALRNAMYFPTGSLNAFQKAEYNDKFGFYQSQFGVYSYMNLTSDLTFKIHYPQGLPMMWQTHNSCAWTPLQTLSFGNIEVAPKRAKINEQMCYDEFFDSGFSAFLEWSQNPAVAMSSAGMDAINAISETIVKNATLGGRVAQVAGQLFNPASVATVTDAPTRIVQAFEKTAQTVQGWIQLCIALQASDATKYGHLNDATLITAGNLSGDGTTYTEATKTVIQLYDENLAAAKAPLRTAIIEGGVGGFTDVAYPLWMVSSSIYNALDTRWKAQKASATINEPRIKYEPFTYQTSRGPRTIYVFMIDNTIVVPVREPSAFAQHLTGTPHFCYLTMSGNINLGGSFANIPVAGQTDVAVMIQQSQDAKDLGTYHFLSHALMASAIADTDYIAGGYVYATP